MKIMMWKCHVDDSTKGSYDMIVGRYILTTMVIYLNCFTNNMQCVTGTYKGCTTPMIKSNEYEFEPKNGKILP